MKFLSLKNTGLGLAAFAFIFYGCSGTAEETGESSEKENTKTVLVEEGRTPTIEEQVVIDYLAVKDAMVETDMEATRVHAVKLLESLKKVPEKSYGDAAEAANAIVGAENMEMQRQIFHKLSHIMFDILKNDNPTDVVLYKQYCPMAFNNEGAFWISAEKNIMNPYFGDKMLKCGVVQEEL